MPRGGIRPGQGRKNVLGECKQVAVKLPLPLLEKVRKDAEEKQTTISNVLRQLIEKEYA